MSTHNICFVEDEPEKMFTLYLLIPRAMKIDLITFKLSSYCCFSLTLELDSSNGWLA